MVSPGSLRKIGTTSIAIWLIIVALGISVVTSLGSTSQAQQLLKKLQELSEERTSLNSEVTSLRAQVGVLQTQMNSLKDQRDKLQSLVSSAERLISSLENQLFQSTGTLQIIGVIFRYHPDNLYPPNTVATSVIMSNSSRETMCGTIMYRIGDAPPVTEDVCVPAGAKYFYWSKRFDAPRGSPEVTVSLVSVRAG